MRPLTPRERRIAAVALLLAALLLAYFVLLHWWFVAPQLAIDTEMHELRDTQSRYATALAEQPLLQKRIATLGRGQAANRAFLPEDDPNAAAAGLMQRVVDVVAAHAGLGHCEVTQKMPVQNDSSDGDPYRKASVNISLRCNIRPLAAVLYDLEQGTPYLFVDDFSVYRMPSLQQDNNGRPLEVQFTLSGYVRGAAPAAAGKGRS